MAHSRTTFVPQIFNLLYRRFAIGNAVKLQAHAFAGPADCKSALQQIENLHDAGRVHSRRLPAFHQP
jgi:hypothetical protein